MDERLKRMQAHPRTVELAKRRTRISGFFTFIVGGAFFALVLVVGFWPATLNAPLAGPHFNVGTVCAIALLLLCIGLNALYVIIYRRQLESLRDQILKETLT